LEAEKQNVLPANMAALVVSLGEGVDVLRSCLFKMAMSLAY